METKENLHQGHRQRLLKKLSTSRELLADHELLEALLFYSIPRRDTNGLAHRLLKMFGGLGGVFRASKAELLSVSGVGAKTAEILLLVGELYHRAVEDKKPPVELNTTEKIKKELGKEFVNQRCELSVLVLLDKNYKKIFQLNYDSMNELEVAINLNEIVGVFASFRPSFIVLAHNHPKGECYPSKEDDKTTKKLELLCAIHGVTLLEHMIFKGEEGYYSYRDELRLNLVKNQTDLDRLLNLGGKDNE